MSGKKNCYFPYLLIFSVIAAAMEVDLSLPSFPDIARAFSVSEDVVTGTISLNFLSFCFSALFYGPLSDRFGRRPVMLFGTGLFLIGSIGCTLAPTIHLLLLSRFIQGLGAAASFVIVFTMISDVYKGQEATRWIGLFNACLTVTMALAPILGGILNTYFGWQSCYSFIALLTFFIFSLLLFFLPETRPGQNIKIDDVIKDYYTLFSSKRFLQSSLVPTLLAGGYMSFITVIPFLYRDQMGMSLTQFSLHQALIVASFSLMSYYAPRVSNYWGEKKSALTGLRISAITTAVLLLFTYLTPLPQAWQITPLMTICAAACAVSFAVIFSASLALFPDKNGAASSLIMAMRTFVCASSIQLAGSLYNHTLFPTGVLITLSFCTSLALATNFYRRQAVIS